MPGIVLNPIAHFSQAEAFQPEPPYVPSYDAIYASSYNLYKVSGSQLGSVTSGGIVKMDFDGDVVDTWVANANVGGGVGRTLKEVRKSQGARDSIVMDCRIVSASTEYRELRLVDKTSGAISDSLGLVTDFNDLVYGMSTDTEEEYVYIYGEVDMKLSGSATTKGLTRVPHDTLDLDSSFETNVGDGPTNEISSAGAVWDVHVNKNGKIGVVHNGRNWNNVSNKNHSFVVLNQDGTVDTTFDFGASQFRDKFDEEISNPVRTCHWFESGSSGVWVVGGIFEKFGGVDYKFIMAFKEDGTVDTQWTTNFQELQAGNDLNNTVRDISVDINTPNYAIITGDFTTKGGGPCNRMAAIEGNTGFPQLLGTGTKPELRNTLIHNSEIYYLMRGTQTTDQSGTIVNVDGMYGANIYSFNHTANFDIGAGLETSLNAFAEPGSIFLG